MRLGDLDDLREKISNTYIDGATKTLIKSIIDNAPTIAVDEEIERQREEIERQREEMYQSSKKLYETARMLGVERPQGEWIYDNSYSYFKRCSICQKIAGFDCDVFKFCPYCGADMRGGDKE